MRGGELAVNIYNKPLFFCIISKSLNNDNKAMETEVQREEKREREIHDK